MFQATKKDGFMAKVIIKLNVAYISCLLKTFKHQDRSKAGGKNFILAVDDNDHNLAYIIADWNSVQSAKDFWASREGKSQIAEWNSVIKPEFTFLRETPDD